MTPFWLGVLVGSSGLAALLIVVCGSLLAGARWASR